MMPFYIVPVFNPFCLMLPEMNKEDLKALYEPKLAEKRAHIAQLEADQADLNEFKENEEEYIRKRDVNFSAVEAQ